MARQVSPEHRGSQSLNDALIHAATDGRSALIATARQRTPEPGSTPEDTVQEAFLKLMEKKADVAEKAGKTGKINLDGLVYRTVQNATTDSARRNGVRANKGIVSLEQTAEKYSGNVDALPMKGAEPDFSASLEQQELRAEIMHALHEANLPPLKIQLFLEHHLHGLSYKELARIHDITEANVKIIIHRAGMALATVPALQQAWNDFKS